MIICRASCPSSRRSSSGRSYGNAGWLLEQTASSSVSSECERRNSDSFLVIFSASGSMQTICGIGDRKPRLKILDLARNPMPSRTGSSYVALAKSAVYEYHNKHFHELLWIPPDKQNLASPSQPKSHIPIRGAVSMGQRNTCPKSSRRGLGG